MRFLSIEGMFPEGMGLFCWKVAVLCGPEPCCKSSGLSVCRVCHGLVWGVAFGF
jgi:hypothetical protein